MKRCPECRRDYYDDSLLYCLEDGVALVQGAVPSPAEPSTSGQFDEPQTAILHETTDSGEAATRAQIHTTAADSRSHVGESSEKQSLSANRAAKPLLIGGVAVIAILGVFFGYLYLSPTKQINSIAVMPFVNESGDVEVDYLSDGMTETLISSLSNLPNLSVKPRSTVFRYKGRVDDPQKIGEELDVQAILYGRIVQRGDDISLFVELTDIASESVVWSETYKRKQADLVSLQSEIARDVSSNIKTRLSGDEIAKVTKTYTADPEAYQMYLKGNFYYAKFTYDGYQKAIEYYQKAIDIDPEYALPYHGIAAAHDFANGFYIPPRESGPKAKEAALKALELDNKLAETHYLLGKILYWYEWDWAAAEKEWKRANQLDPSYPTFYPPYLQSIGRDEDAIKFQQKLWERSPLDLNASLDLALILLQADRVDRSIDQVRKALEVDPNFWWSYQTLGLAYARKGRYPEAIEALEKAISVDKNPTSLGYLGYVYAVSGKKAEARKVLEQLKGLSKTEFVDPFCMVTVFAGLDDKDQAFEWLERAYQERSFYMAIIRTEIILDGLRSDPRFKEFLKRMNLPE